MSWPVAPVLTAVLIGLALIHAYWGFGGRWPAPDEASLTASVVGRYGRMPGLVPSLVVAAALAVCAGSVLLYSHAGWPGRVIYWGAALVFLARGLVTYLTPLMSYAVGTPFHRLDRLAYAPLCLAIAAAFAFNAYQKNMTGDAP